MLIARQPPASTHIVACVERMFFTSRSQPRIIIPHAARCCKPFFSILPNFFEKIWRMPPLTADFPPGGFLLFKTCRIISFSGGRTVFFSAFSSRGVSYHTFSQKKSPAGRFFPAGLCLIHVLPRFRLRQTAEIICRSGRQFALVPAGGILDPQGRTVPGNAGLLAGDDLVPRRIDQAPLVPLTHRHIAV